MPPRGPLVVAAALAVVLGAGAPAHAAPAQVEIADGRATLPSGLVLELRDTELVVRRDQLAVVVFDEPPWRGPCPDGTQPKAGSCGMSLDRVTVNDDGSIDVDLGWGGTAAFRTGELEARLDIATAARQRGTAAIATLEHALAGDPRSWEATRDLAVRRLADRDPDGAAGTVAALLKRDVLPTYHRLILEPRLRALLARPAIAALRAATAGKLRLRKLPADGAWSATIGAVAIGIQERVNTSGHRGWDESDPLIVFQRIGADHPELALPGGETATIERLLRDFDFEVDPGVERGVESNDPGAPAEDVLSFAQAGLSVRLARDDGTSAGRDDSIRVLRGDRLVARDVDCHLATLTSGSFLPAAGIVVVTDSQSWAAGDDRVCVIAVPRAP